MDGAHAFLKALATVLCVAAVTTVLFQKLRQPVVLGYVVAGLVVGPHVPIPLVADTHIVESLSELGVILLMFSLGLEFSIRKLVQLGPTAGLTAVIECSLMLWLGFVFGQLAGWSARESLFAGALIAISSTTIIAKAFDERSVRGRLRELVLGVLIVEDLIAILLMAGLTALSQGTGLSASELGVTAGRLAAFLAGLVVVGMLVIPRAVRAIRRLNRPETTLVASIGICFAVSLLAQYFGYSVALGAFVAGSLVAESGEGREIEHLVQPVRDVFAAVFFVSVGMLIDPALVVRHWGSIIVLTTVVVLGKIVSVSAGAFLTGNGTRVSIQAGMSMAQIGEFSFIIAGLGLSLGATGAFLYPVAVAVSALTTLLTPWLIRASGPAAAWVDHKLPHPLQTFAALYGSWIERLRTAPPVTSERALARRLGGLLLLDAAALAGVVVGASVFLDPLGDFARKQFGVGRAPVLTAVLIAASLLALPLVFGIVRVARGLAVALARLALPEQPGVALDRAAAPRRALVVTLQFAAVLAVGAPLVALTQPFLPGFQGGAALLALVAVLGIAFWRSATNLEGHVRAGAEVIVAALASQSPGTAEQRDQALAEVHHLLPGLGEPAPFRIRPGSRAVGRTLADLNLRALTGATVIAIRRSDAGVVAPRAGEVLREGDVLALAGTHEAIEAARALLAAQTEGT